MQAEADAAPGALEDNAVLREPPFFIVGSGRSGTTLMRSLLSSHSRLAVTPETRFLKSCLRLGGVSLDDQPRDYREFWAAYCRTPRFAALGVTPGHCEGYFPQDRDPGFADMFAALLRAFLDKSGKQRVGEKTPSHLHHAGWLFARFPQARMIAMRRDPRAMIASLLQTPGARAKTIYGVRRACAIPGSRRWLRTPAAGPGSTAICCPT